MHISCWERLEQVTEQFNIERKDICIVGSAVLAFAGIQKNHDIDLVLYPLARKKFLDKYREKVEVLKSGTINFTTDVQSARNKYAKIGIVDEELFNEKYSIRRDGYWIAKLELEIAQKIERNIEKDRNHLEKIGNSYLDIEGFDRKLFEELIGKKRAIIFGAGENAKLAYYCYCTKFELICYVDNNVNLWGINLNGLKVCSPDILKDTDAIIIISSQQHAEEIKKDIYTKFGKRKVVTFCMKEELSILGE